MLTNFRGGDLPTFNRLVRQVQDQAYTLAWRYLGDDRLAEDTLQTAIMDVYRQSGAVPPAAFRSALFQALVRRLLSANPPPARLLASRDPAEIHFSAHLRALCPRCRLAVILIDCLRMTYVEAARASGLSLPEIRECLAEARVSLSQG